MAIPYMYRVYTSWNSFRRNSLSQKAGYSPIEIGFLSLFVFSGSGQFITSSMLIAHSSMFSIILTTFIVNLRHISNELNSLSIL